MKTAKEHIEIEFLKSKTYTEINEMFNQLNDQSKSKDDEITELKDKLEMKTFQLKASDSDYATKSESNDSIKFAEWCAINEWRYNPMHNDWFNTTIQPFKTSHQLYELFNQCTEKENGSSSTVDSESLTVVDDFIDTFLSFLRTYNLTSKWEKFLMSDNESNNLSDIDYKIEEHE